MWIERLLTSRVTHAIELTARFAEARHQVLTENVANIDTPDYHVRRLDAGQFQTALREAFRAAEGAKPAKLELRGAAQVGTDGQGRLRTRPAVEPAENVLFHDGTNARLEGLMTDVMRNSLTYEFATTLLRSRFDGLLTAIRGRVR
jgi:flagellar basal-body rod protein FlgB